MKLPIPDLIVFFVLIFGNVIFGASFFFKNKTSAQLTSGGGRLLAWVVGISIFATFVSSISFLALPGNSYLSNRNAFVFSLSIPIISVLAVQFFVPLYRSLECISACNYLEILFGTWARIYASACYILTQIIRTGAILLSFALTIYALLGRNVQTIIIVIRNRCYRQLDALGHLGRELNRRYSANYTVCLIFRLEYTLAKSFVGKPILI